MSATNYIKARIGHAREIGARFGVGRAIVGQIKRKTSWRHLIAAEAGQ